MTTPVPDPQPSNVDDPDLIAFAIEVKGWLAGHHHGPAARVSDSIRRLLLAKPHLLEHAGLIGDGERWLEMETPPEQT